MYFNNIFVQFSNERFQLLADQLVFSLLVGPFFSVRWRSLLIESFEILQPTESVEVEYGGSGGAAMPSFERVVSA